MFHLFTGIYINRIGDVICWRPDRVKPKSYNIARYLLLLHKARNINDLGGGKYS